MPSVRRLVVVLLLLGLVLPLALRAQVGSTTDIITGRVTNAAGAPIEGATVTVTSLETRVNRSQRTGGDGRYTVVFPDGGGQYRLTVRYIGFEPVTVAVQRGADEDRFVADVRLGAPVPQQLATVNVRERRAPPAPRGEPGQSGASFTPEQAARLPVDQNDLNALAALAPGVVSVAGTDSTAASFSVAGQRPTQNNVTLDGVSFGSAGVPQDAVRNTRVVTNSYDVARGQFTGGQIASTTRSGTNVVQGSGSASLRDPALQWRPNVPGAYGQGYTQQQLSGGAGGPIVEDRLFVYGAGQLRLRDDPLQSLVGADPTTLRRLGASADSAVRFLSSLRALGVDPVGGGGVASSRRNANASAIVRLDWNATEAHTLTLRGDWRRTTQDASRVSSYSVPSYGGDATSDGGGLMATLTSRFGASWVHELRGYLSADRRSSDPYVAYPAGRVRVASDDAAAAAGGGAGGAASLGVTTFAFGANPSLPSDGRTSTFEGTDELSWLSRNGGHRVKLGALLNASRYDQTDAVNRYGTFTYASIADLEAGRPSLFTRTLVPAGADERRGSATNAALYLGDTWRRSRALQLTYGARLEGSAFGGAPAYNAAVDRAFGVRTDRFDSELRASPRVGFSYTRFPAPQQQGGGGGGGGGFGGGAPTLLFRGGLGEFRGRTPSSLYSAAQQGSGLPGAQRQLFCVGDAVPTPDYAGYLGAGGVSAIPSECADATTGTPVTAAPSVTAFAHDFGAPRAWRASLGVTRRFWERYGASLDGAVAYGRSLYGVTDVNLDAAPKFRLADEGSRPVFVAPADVVPATGAVPLAASRRDAGFGQVLVLGSGLRSTTAQLTASVNGFTSKGAIFNLSYTLSRSRDQSSYAQGPASYGFAAPTTAGDPNRLDWARSDLDRRHNVIGTLTYPLRQSFEVTMVGRLTSGGAYTPLVAGDVNGDGSRGNDRAYVFRPADVAASDPSLAGAMARLLAGAPANARACLERQLGRIAGRNSCAEPWTPSLDLQLNYRPDRLGLKRRLTLSLVAVNTLAGVDQALHGANDLRGWGQPTRPDPTLLYVRGFDAANRRFVYDVNERFGDTRGTAAAFRQPFQVAIQARYAYNLDALRERFGAAGEGVRAIVIGGGGGAGGAGAAAAGGPGGAGAAVRLGSRVPNPLAQILELRDTLALTPEQAARLQTLSDTLARKNDALGEQVRALVQKAGNNPDPAVLFATIRPKLNEGRANLEQAVKDAQAILTPEQWAKVPESVKNPIPGAGGRGVRRERRQP